MVVDRITVCAHCLWHTPNCFELCTDLLSDSSRGRHVARALEGSMHKKKRVLLASGK